jgi:hypothetical protein
MSATPTTRSGVQYLVPPETVAVSNGVGEPLKLGPLASKQLLIVLRVADIIEQESLHVAVWGAEDGKEWGKKPLFWFPQQFYRGATPAALDLSLKPQVKFLQARWEVNRWGRGYPRPYFVFSVEAEEFSSAPDEAR